MLDPQHLRAEPELYREACRQKGTAEPGRVDAWLAADQRRRESQTAADALKARQRVAGERMRDRALSEADRAALREELTAIKQQVQELEDRQRQAEADSASIMLDLPALPDAAWPVGPDASHNRVVRAWADPQRPPQPLGEGGLDHISLATNLRLADFERGVKIAGSRSYVLTGAGAMLHQAVLRFAMDVLLGRGYTPFVVPVLVTQRCMEGTGYFPAGREQAYITQDGNTLVGTSEVALASYHGEEMLPAGALPIRMCAVSTCFRREAGAAGRDTAGLYRVHQFDKVEQVVIHAADTAEHVALHEEIIANSEFILQALRLPYRVVQNCTGDMGQGKWRMYDIETWMPSRAEYCETHSGSALRDFQARRLNLRYRERDEHGRETRPQFCYTLNNTAIASPRILIPLLECYQMTDGRVEVPEVLRPYMRGQDVLG